MAANQAGKAMVKLPLYAGYMILHIENPEDTTKEHGGTVLKKKMKKILF